MKKVRQPVWVALVLAVCWSSMALGAFSIFIIAALIAGIVLSLRKKNWLALVAVGSLNPLLVFFVRGIISYYGNPTLTTPGKPHLESYNVDRATRCFRRSGGCRTSGNEWVTFGARNAGLQVMSRVMGPPAGSYDGPYPTREEAAACVSDAEPTPVRLFLQATVLAGGETIAVDESLTGRLVERLRFASLLYPEDDDYEGTIRAALYQQRCLVIQVEEHMADQSEAEYYRGLLILVDMEKHRPFAYFRMRRASAPHLPPVRYRGP